MGMYLSSNIGISIGQFNKACFHVGLPGAKINDYKYIAIIDYDRYIAYENKAEILFDRLYNCKKEINVHEFEFLSAWRIVNSARIDWLVENDPQQENVWEDIYFT